MSTKIRLKRHGLIVAGEFKNVSGADSFLYVKPKASDSGRSNECGIDIEQRGNDGPKAMGAALLLTIDRNQARELVYALKAFIEQEHI